MTALLADQKKVTDALAEQQNFMRYLRNNKKCMKHTDSNNLVRRWLNKNNLEARSDLDGGVCTIPGLASADSRGGDNLRLKYPDNLK